MYSTSDILGPLMCTTSYKKVQTIAITSPRTIKHEIQKKENHRPISRLLQGKMIWATNEDMRTPVGADEDARSCNRLKEGVLLNKCGWAHRADKASGCDIMKAGYPGYD